MGVDVSALSVEEAGAAARDAILQLVRDLDQPHRLRDVGVEPDDFAAIAKDALEDLIVATNPRPVSSPDEVVGLLQSAY
jgi:alcohol dehydrogenase